MRQVILTVPDEQFAPLMKLVRALPFAIKAKAVVPPKPKSTRLSSKSGLTTSARR